jgi:hypothetical protein
MPPLVGFQTGQCCRGHFRKPRVETLTEIHRQPYSITRPLRRALMSAWGQFRKSALAILTSVLPSTADIRQRGGHVRKVPTTEVPASFVHPVGRHKTLPAAR